LQIGDPADYKSALQRLAVRTASNRPRRQEKFFAKIFYFAAEPPMKKAEKMKHGKEIF
jgi:hypothetical protein